MMQDPEVYAWLAGADQVTDLLFKNARYGFPTAIAEYYLDLVFFGTGSTYVEDLPSIGPRFYSRPLGEVYIDESFDGKVDSVYRLYSLTYRRFIQQFGKKGNEKEATIADKEPNRTLRMIHATHPRKELTTGPARQDQRPWRSAQVLCETKRIVQESGYWTNPWQVARWGTEAGSLYGSGCPGWISLSDQKMLNEMSKVLITQSQKLMAPPLLIPDDGVMTQIDTSPDSLTVYRAGVFKDDPIRQMPVSDKTLIGEKIIEQRQDMVQRAFYGHLLQLFDQGGMTATQSLEMETKAARILVSTIARLAGEGSSPMLERTLDIAERGGLIPPRPPQMAGAEIQLEYLSPVMRSQRQQEARAVLNTWASAGQMAQVTPEVFDNLDADQSIRMIAEAEGVPKGVLVAEDERDEVRAMRAQQQQQQEAMQQLGQGVQLASQIAEIEQQAGGGEGTGVPIQQ
jgi:hypothetical protein